MAGGGERELARADEAPCGLDADDAAVVRADSCDCATLDDVDTARIGAARIAPGDRIVTRGAAARLIEAAVDRKAGAVEVKEGHHLADRVAVEQFGVDA